MVGIGELALCVVNSRARAGSGWFGELAPWGVDSCGGLRWVG